MKGRGPFRKRPMLERFIEKIEFTESCWLWTAFLNRGYGRFGVDYKIRDAHLIAYETWVGPRTPGLQIDHACHDPLTCNEKSECPHRRCVNPDHLIEVTVQVNTLRSNSLSALRARQTQCLRGHPFTERNTYRDNRNRRLCRECHRICEGVRRLRQREGEVNERYV